jgi:hypothetical protein
MIEIIFRISSLFDKRILIIIAFKIKLYKIITIFSYKILLPQNTFLMIKRLLPFYFCNNKYSSSSKYCLRASFDFHHCLTTTTNHEENMCLPKDYIIQQRDIRSIYARRSEFI